MNEVLGGSDSQTHFGLFRGRARHEGSRPGGLVRYFLARCAPRMENTMVGGNKSTRVVDDNDELLSNSVARRHYRAFEELTVGFSVQ